jgi:BirA family biotin operon repressor/biotin-[acetyl-CoA-carboxylase] ligase
VKLDLDLLDLLVAAGGEAVSVSFLRKTFGLPPEDVLRRVEELRNAGYVIEWTYPHGSTACRLLEYPDILYAHEVKRRLKTDWAGKWVERRDSCPSTNDEAMELLRDGAPSGTVILAEEQTAGRGRGERRWHSPSGPGLYLSLIYRPDPPLSSPAVMQIATGVAVAYGVMRVTGRPARLRWPNDVLMEGGKVAGLLVEATGTDAGRTAYVVGIGLNVNHEQEDFPEDLRSSATSLATVAGKRFARVDVLATLLGALERWYGRMEEGAVDDIADAWRPLSSLLDQDVVLLSGERRISGRVTDLSPVKGVLLETRDGESSWVPAEHVSFIRPADEMTGE